MEGGEEEIVREEREERVERDERKERLEREAAWRDREGRDEAARLAKREEARVHLHTRMAEQK
eukprot:3649354-Rhodomonas_salina.1